MIKSFVFMLIQFHLYPPVLTCPSLIPLFSGSISGNCTVSKANDTCEHSCEVGYVLKGERILTCLSTGEWNCVVPSCQQVTCNDVREPDYGFISGDCEPGISTKICSFDCEQGYEIVGPSAIVCQGDGSWDKQPPICRKLEVITCKNMNYHSFGKYMGQCVPGKPSRICRLRCAYGYSLVGHEMMACERDGQWHYSGSTGAPSCKKNS